MSRPAMAVAFGWLVLAAAFGAVRGEEPRAPETTCKPSGEGWTICSRLDLEELRSSGATTWHVWLEGTHKPSRIRLHNGSPEVVRLNGGPDLTLHTGCRLHSRFRVKVRAAGPRGVRSVGPAAPHLIARPVDPSPKKEASIIAAEIAPLLRALEARFREARSRLPVIGTGPSGTPIQDSKVVADLLDSTEESLLAILSYRELAAMRDSVRYEFREARRIFREERAQAWRAPGSVSPNRFVLAAFRVSQSQAVPAKAPPSSNASVWDRIQRLLGRVTEVAEKEDLVIDVCAASEPASGWAFHMHPKSAPEPSHNTTTNDTLPNITRGRYAWAVYKGARQFKCSGTKDDKHGCALNLLDWEDEIISCNLGNGICYLRNEPQPPPRCRPVRTVSKERK